MFRYHKYSMLTVCSKKYHQYNGILIKKYVIYMLIVNTKKFTELSAMMQPANVKICQCYAIM